MLFDGKSLCQGRQRFAQRTAFERGSAQVEHGAACFLQIGARHVHGLPYGVLYALGIGAGAQIMQPLAIAVIGGFVFSGPVVLFLLPGLYRLLDPTGQLGRVGR